MATKKSTGQVLPLSPLITPKDVTVTGFSADKSTGQATTFTYTVNGVQNTLSLNGVDASQLKNATAGITPEGRLALQAYTETYGGIRTEWQSNCDAQRAILNDKNATTKQKTLANTTLSNLEKNEPKVGDYLTTEQLNFVYKKATEWGVGYDPTSVSSLAKTQTYSQPSINGQTIVEDVSNGFAYTVAKDRQIDGQISTVDGRMDAIRGEKVTENGVTSYKGGLLQQNSDDIIKTTIQLGQLKEQYPDISGSSKPATDKAVTNLTNFENSSDYSNMLKQERWKSIGDDKTLTEDQKLQERLKLTLPGVTFDETMSELDKQKEVIDRLGSSGANDELYRILNDDSKSEEEKKVEVDSLYKNVVNTTTPMSETDYSNAKSTHTNLQSALTEATKFDKAVQEYKTLSGKISKLEETDRSLRDELSDLDKAKQQLQQEKTANRTEMQKFGLGDGTKGTVSQKGREFNTSYTASTNAGKPTVAQGSGSGSFANPGQTLNENVTYYSIEKGETEGTYKIKGGTSDPIDLEQYRYYQSNEAHRVGYTLLACGTYSDNVYNNNNGKNKGYNQLNSISFILPLPDSSVKLATKATWQEQNEEGINEATAALANPQGNQTNIISAGASKFVQAKVMEMAGKYGVNGALRGVALAYNPNKQLYFEGVDLDSFDMSFSLVPKNKEEATKIKIFAEAINMLMLPGTSSNGSNINALSELGKIFEQAGNQINGQSILDGIAKTLANMASGFGKFVSNVFSLGNGTAEGLASPYFSYPGLWSVGVYVPVSGGTNDYCILERNRLAMTSCDLTFGGEKITWHGDGFPTVMKMTLSFKESQYRVKENMANLVSFLGGSNNFNAYKDTVTSNLEQERIGQKTNNGETLQQLITRMRQGGETDDEIKKNLIEKGYANNPAQAENMLNTSKSISGW